MVLALGREGKSLALTPVALAAFSGSRAKVIAAVRSALPARATDLWSVREWAWHGDGPHGRKGLVEVTVPNTLVLAVGKRRRQRVCEAVYISVIDALDHGDYVVRVRTDDCRIGADWKGSWR